MPNMDYLSVQKALTKNNPILRAYPLQIESTYSQVSKALCCKENATPAEILQAVDQLKSRIANVELERDAAIKDLSYSCQYCKHISCDDDDDGSPCKDCFQRKDGILFAPMVRVHFEWRGVCPENTKEESSDAD